MQTFVVKLACLFLFGFIFFSAYQQSNHVSLFSSAETATEKSTLVATKIETKQFKVESLKPIPLGMN